MAERRTSRTRRPPQRQTAPRRRPRQPKAVEFKPDKKISPLKTLRWTYHQRMRILKWTLYALTLIIAIVVQDVIMSNVRFLGATTDLPICVILLITLVEGIETGSLFVLFSSVFYFYSGTAPFAYSIGIVSFFGIFACLIRQMYLSRSKTTIVFCAGVAGLLYELGIFAMGIFLGLTRWDRIPVFLITGAINFIVMIPLYSLICKIGLIGGNTWKE